MDCDLGWFDNLSLWFLLRRYLAKIAKKQFAGGNITPSLEQGERHFKGILYVI